jgi:hypothetical protein
MNIVSRTQSKKRFSLIVTGFFLLVTISLGVFVYLVSPLRDPAFQPNSANAGSLIPWMRNISESDWGWVVFPLAIVDASSLTVLIKQFSPSRDFRASHPVKRRILQVLRFEFWLTLGSAICFILSLFFVFYLLEQWIID